MGGVHRSQTWTGMPFFALLTRPVIGVNRTGASEPEPDTRGRMGTFEGAMPPDEELCPCTPYIEGSIESVLSVLCWRARVGRVVKDDVDGAGVEDLEGWWLNNGPRRLAVVVGVVVVVGEEADVNLVSSGGLA